MDQTFEQQISARAPAADSAGRLRAWARIRWRARHVRRLRRRDRRSEVWVEAVSPWAFWGLHR